MRYERELCSLQEVLGAYKGMLGVLKEIKEKVDADSA
jgi:hypothetical protein